MRRKKKRIQRLNNPTAKIRTSSFVEYDHNYLKSLIVLL